MLWTEVEEILQSYSTIITFVITCSHHPFLVTSSLQHSTVKTYDINISKHYINTELGRFLGSKYNTVNLSIHIYEFIDYEIHEYFNLLKKTTAVGFVDCVNS